MPEQLSDRFTLDDTRKSSLQNAYNVTEPELQETTSDVLKLRPEFDNLAPFRVFAHLSPTDCSIALRACLLLFYATGNILTKTSGSKRDTIQYQLLHPSCSTTLTVTCLMSLVAIEQAVFKANQDITLWCLTLYESRDFALLEEGPGDGWK
ncbi:hypothetical protein DENSPDRAFT_872137 [Dentipellis sp. KUC8613]|nr:hypothetical protein DENSPDRAFT_872137 [Dentipellis sp. KUC8613]